MTTTGKKKSNDTIKTNCQWIAARSEAALLEAGQPEQLSEIDKQVQNFLIESNGRINIGKIKPDYELSELRIVRVVFKLLADWQ